MLEVVSFNNSLFRYRSESDNLGVVYNLRFGTILLVRGKTKNVIEALIDLGEEKIDTDNEAINYLLGNFVLIRKEDRK